jgi:hypothetical protein
MSTTVAQYLCEHPDVFSDVLTVLLEEGPPVETRDHSPVVSSRPFFGMPKGKNDNMKRGEDEPDLFLTLLVDDTREKIIDVLINQATHDPSAYLALFHLALVTKDLRAQVQYRLDLLMPQIDIVSIYSKMAMVARNVKEMRDTALERLAIYAPAIYRAWLLIDEHPRIRDKTSELFRFFAQLQLGGGVKAWVYNAGRDPIATLISIHWLAGEASRLTPDDVNWLLTMTSDTDLAIAFRPIDPVPTSQPVKDYMRMLRLVSLRRQLPAGLAVAPHVGMALNELIARIEGRTGDDVSVIGQWQSAYWTRARKGDKRTLKRLWWSLCEQNQREAQLLFYAFADSPPPPRVSLSEHVKALAIPLYCLFDYFLNTPSRDKLFQFALETIRQLESTTNMGIYSRRQCLMALIRLFANRVYDPNYVSMLFSLILNPDNATDIEANTPSMRVSVLYYAIHYGNEALVALWVKDFWPIVRQSQQPIARDIFSWLIAERLVLKYGDLQARLFTILMPVFREQSPLDNYPLSQTLVGDALYSILREQYGTHAQFMISIDSMHVVFELSRMTSPMTALQRLGLVPSTVSDVAIIHALRLCLHATIPSRHVRAIFQFAHAHATNIDQIGQLLITELKSFDGTFCNNAASWVYFNSRLWETLYTDTNVLIQRAPAGLLMVDHPLLFLGMLKQLPFTDSFTELNVVFATIHHLVLSLGTLGNTRTSNIADTSIENLAFLLRNGLMVYSEYWWSTVDRKDATVAQKRHLYANYEAKFKNSRLQWGTTVGAVMTPLSILVEHTRDLAVSGHQ